MLECSCLGCDEDGAEADYHQPAIPCTYISGNVPLYTCTTCMTSCVCFTHAPTAPSPLCGSRPRFTDGGHQKRSFRQPPPFWSQDGASRTARWKPWCTYVPLTWVLQPFLTDNIIILVLRSSANTESTAAYIPIVTVCQYRQIHTHVGNFNLHHSCMWPGSMAKCGAEK